MPDAIHTTAVLATKPTAVKSGRVLLPLQAANGEWGQLSLSLGLARGIARDLAKATGLEINELPCAASATPAGGQK